jgi:hypothetical protein
MPKRAVLAIPHFARRVAIAECEDWNWTASFLERFARRRKKAGETPFGGSAANGPALVFPKRKQI